MCQSEKDATEHAIECNKGDRQLNLQIKHEKNGKRLSNFLRKNKENRSQDHIKRRTKCSRRIEEKRTEQKKATTKKRLQRTVQEIKVEDNARKRCGRTKGQQKKQHRKKNTFKEREREHRREQQKRKAKTENRSTVFSNIDSA